MPKVINHNLIRLSRVLPLLFNRASMYDIAHPYVKQAINEFLATIEPLLKSNSPLVLIMSREQLFLDDDIIDPRINVNKIVAHFKKTDIQSISFERGLDKNELKLFLQIFNSLSHYPHAKAMRTALFEKGIDHIKINHVIYKKMTQNDEIVSREALKKVTPHVMSDADEKTKKSFLNSVLESVIAEEFEKTLNIKTMMSNPVGFSKALIETDLASYRDSTDENRTPGPVLLYQIQQISDKVNNALDEDATTDMAALAEAVFQMKKQLLAGIKAQKALDIVYAEEEQIVDRVTALTDNVLVTLIKDEYKKGNISPSRMAYLLRRLVPEPEELKRILPEVKKTLLAEGMSIDEYLNLIELLTQELQSDDVVKIIKQSAHEAGVSGDEVLDEMKKNPAEIAKLISLAAEIRDDTGDDTVLTDILVNYIERLGLQMAREKSPDEGAGENRHLRAVVTELESSVLGNLRKMNLGEDKLRNLEERFNKRVDEIIERMRIEWLRSQTEDAHDLERQPRSVLQILEQSVGERGELAEILKSVRVKVRSEECDENNFSEIFAEILQQKEHKKTLEANKKLPDGVLKSDTLVFILEKEISRAKRYDIPFAVLGFTVIKATPKDKVSAQTISKSDLMDALLGMLFQIMRETDIIGLLGKNALAVILPMTPQSDARFALRRSMKQLHTESIEINGVPMNIMIAGVVTTFDEKQTPNTKVFLKTLTSSLMDQAIRVRNIHTLV